MPGLPLEGVDGDDDGFEDDDIDFDNMDVDLSFSSDEVENEFAHSDTGSDETQPQFSPVIESTPPVEDDVHDNLTTKESDRS
jgi:hypothetical protein